MSLMQHNTASFLVDPQGRFKILTVVKNANNHHGVGFDRKKARAAERNRKPS
jgi:hypothetical protein